MAHKPAKVARIFKVADVDGSGALSKEEVGKYLCRQERVASELVGAFHRQDVKWQRKITTLRVMFDCQIRRNGLSNLPQEVTDKLASLKLFVPDWQLVLQGNVAPGLHGK